MAENTLYFGDNLKILRDNIRDESVDLIYLDPPFNSKANYKVLFKSPEPFRTVLRQSRGSFLKPSPFPFSLASSFFLLVLIISPERRFMSGKDFQDETMLAAVRTLRTANLSMSERPQPVALRQLSAED